LDATPVAVHAKMNLFGFAGSSGIAIADALLVAALYGQSDIHWPLHLWKK
jgi:hypothetical protein